MRIRVLTYRAVQLYPQADLVARLTGWRGTHELAGAAEAAVAARAALKYVPCPSTWRGETVQCMRSARTRVLRMAVDLSLTEPQDDAEERGSAS